jgi:16S rRNA processing protein RimM
LQDRRIRLGHVSGPFGVRGWLKVHSETEPLENILSYRPWLIEIEGDWRALDVLEGRRQGKHLVVRVAGCEDRDQALAYRGAPLAVLRSQLPPLADGEFYWSDLEGMRVLALDGTDLGKVDHLLDTGANAVMSVSGERTRLIPFVLDRYVCQVSMDEQIIRVDWDTDF